MSFTRRTHVVRCTDPNNPDTYADVEVLDAIGFTLPSGFMVLTCEAKSCSPLIIDNTGDGNGKSSGSPTRTSHMERYTNPDDDSQFIDFEIADRVAFKDQNGGTWILEHPSEKASTFLEGTGADNGPATRSAYPVTLTSKNDPAQIAVIAMPDCMSFIMPNGDRMVLRNPAKAASPSMTPADYNPDDDQSIPPDNNDPNNYVKFVKGSAGPWMGKNKPIKQGPLWWIRKMRGGFEPWWIWQPNTNQPYVWLLEVHPGTLGAPHWDVRGFPSEGEPFFTDYYPGAPSTWQRSAIGSSGGFASLDANATAGLTDPLQAVGKIDFQAPPTHREPGSAGWGPNIWQLTGIKQPQHIDPHTHQPVYDLPSKALAAQVATTFLAMFNGTSDSFNNMMINISGRVATFDDYRIDGRPFSVPNGPTYQFIAGDFVIPYVDGPEAVDGELGNPFYLSTHGEDFFAGMNPGAFDGGADQKYGYVINSFVPAWAAYIGIGQLDPKKWDTSGDTPVLRTPGH